MSRINSVMFFIDKVCRCQIFHVRFAYTIIMYEVTISSPKNQQYFLQYVTEKVNPFMQQINGVIAQIYNDKRSFCTIACDDVYNAQCKRIVTDTVAEVLSLGCKNLYVRNLLGVDSGNFYQNILVDTLCVFDNLEDKRNLCHIIDTANDIYIDGYYNFRMKSIKSRWQEIINMILDSRYILDDDQLILEFLQYLLQSVDSKVKNLSLCFEENNYYICDSSNRILPGTALMSPDATVEEQAMVNVICLNPKKATVYHGKKLNEDFCKMLNYLFDTHFLQVE